MVFFRTSFRTSYFRFILIRNYNGFAVDMDFYIMFIFILARNYISFVVDMDSVRPSDRSQIGLESSETKKCPQRIEIDHFC